MKGFVQDIESIAVKNEEFRRVLYTAKQCQLVAMALGPKEEIGAPTPRRTTNISTARRLNSGFSNVICARPPPRAGDGTL